MGLWQRFKRLFRRQQTKQPEPPRIYGFRSQPLSTGIYFLVAGYHPLSPWFHTISVVAIRKRSEIQEATLPNSRIVAEILRVEARQEYRSAAHALFNGASPNLMFCITATGANKKMEYILRVPVTVQIPYRHLPTTAKRMGESVLYLVENLGPAFRSFLHSSSAISTQYWLNAVLSAYVKELKR